MKLIFLFLFFPFLIVAQESKVTFFDETTKKPILGLQIFSEMGSYIGDTDLNGVFVFDYKLLQQEGIEAIIAFNADYYTQEYKLEEIPKVIHIKKLDYVQLKTVVIQNRGSKKYFTLKGYFRSWQLVNNKLVKYGDGIVEYHLPFDSVKNNVNTGIRNYYKAYRTFKIDSIKSKSKIISFSAFDTYLNTFITKNDKLTVFKKIYTTIPLNDNSGNVYDEDGKVGYVLYNKNHNPIEISITKNFERDNAIKVLLWKISGKDKDIEKWTGEGEVRRPTYLFSSRKRFVKTNVEGKFNNVETICEIFIDEEIIYNDRKPEKYKTSINKDGSFYGSNYWDNQLQKHSLPSEIKVQLTNVNENNNQY